MIKEIKYITITTDEYRKLLVKEYQYDKEYKKLTKVDLDTSRLSDENAKLKRDLAAITAEAQIYREKYNQLLDYTLKNKKVSWWEKLQLKYTNKYDESKTY